MDKKRIVANNISELRKAIPLTQAELAEKLNYSDKAISKWERGESLPDVFVLKEIADIFGVTVDYLLEEVHSLSAKMQSVPRQIKRNRLLISMLSFFAVWLVATTAYVVLGLSADVSKDWLAFVYAVPVSAVVLIVFNSVWGCPKYNFVIISVLLWSTLACIYLTVGDFGNWLLFIVGIPAQVIIILWSGIKAKLVTKKSIKGLSDT